MSRNQGSTMEVTRERGPRPENPRSVACDIDSLYLGVLSLCLMAGPLFWGSEGLVEKKLLGKSPQLLRVSPHL